MVLLVDDDDDFLESATALLETRTDRVRVAQERDPVEALKRLQTEPVRVVIADYRMPHMDGVEFLTRAKAVAPGVPRIMITGYPDLDVAIEAINEAQIARLVTKPPDPQRFVDTVLAMLDAGEQAAARAQEKLRRFRSLAGQRKASS